MKHVEDHFKSCERYELFTGHKSEKNLYLYQKLGYGIFRKEKATENLEFVYLEKYGNGGKAAHDTVRQKDS